MLIQSRNYRNAKWLEFACEILAYIILIVGAVEIVIGVKTLQTAISLNTYSLKNDLHDDIPGSDAQKVYKYMGLLIFDSCMCGFAIVSVIILLAGIRMKIRKLLFAYTICGAIHFFVSLFTPIYAACTIYNMPRTFLFTKPSSFLFTYLLMELPIILSLPCAWFYRSQAIHLHTAEEA